MYSRVSRAKNRRQNGVGLWSQKRKVEFNLQDTVVAGASRETLRLSFTAEPSDLFREEVLRQPTAFGHSTTSTIILDMLLHVEQAPFRYVIQMLHQHIPKLECDQVMRHLRHEVQQWKWFPIFLPSKQNASDLKFTYSHGKPFLHTVMTADLETSLDAVTEDKSYASPEHGFFPAAVNCKPRLLLNARNLDVLTTKVDQHFGTSLLCVTVCLCCCTCGNHKCGGGLCY